MLRHTYEQTPAGDFERGDILKTAAVVSMASLVTAAYVARIGVETARNFVKGQLHGTNAEKTAEITRSSVLSQSLDGLGVEW